MTAHPHTLPNGPCPGARTFGITVRNCVRCGALLDNGDTRMSLDLTSDRLDAIVRETQAAGEELDTDVARTVAGYWHGGQSSAFYAFASSGHYDRAALLLELSDCIATSYDLPDTGADGRLQLDMMGTYLINRTA